MVQYYLVIVLTTASAFQSHTTSKKKTKHPETRENAGEQVVIGFSFESDWLKEWCNFSGPVKERSKA